MNIKKLFLAVAATLLVNGAAMAAEKLRMGVEAAYPPFNSKDTSGQVVGFDVDIGKALCAKMAVECEVVTSDWDGIIPALQSQKFDFLVSSMSITPERSAVVDFTNPNLRVAVQALVADASSVQKLDDLADKTTIVTTGTTADLWLTKNHPDWKLLKFEKNSESLQALASGRGDAYAQDNLVLFNWAKQNPGYRVLAEKLGDEAPIAPAVKKGNTELRDWVNDELAKLGEEKALLKLYDQYVRKDLPADTDPNLVIVEGGHWKP